MAERPITPTHDMLIRLFLDEYWEQPHSFFPYNPLTDVVFVEEEKALYGYKDGCYSKIDEEMRLKPALCDFLVNRKKKPLNEKPISLNITEVLLDSLISVLRVHLPTSSRLTTTQSNFVALEDTLLDVESFQTLPFDRKTRAFSRLKVIREDILNAANPSISWPLCLFRKMAKQQIQNSSSLFRKCLGTSS